MVTSEAPALTDDEMLLQAWNLYKAALERFEAWMKANPPTRENLFHPDSMRLSKQITATRNAWLACGGQEVTVIG